jgi:hypothetical protein
MGCRGKDPCVPIQFTLRLDCNRETIPGNHGGEVGRALGVGSDVTVKR